MEENFEQLLEDYLDENLIEEKKMMDEIILDGTTIFTDSPFTCEDAITINDYVNNFLNIKSNSSKLLHCGLKDLHCPYVIGVSNDYANKNPELVKRGYLLLVIDYHKKRGTYLNPSYLASIMNMEATKEELALLEKIHIHSLEELKDFYSKYVELQQQFEALDKFFSVVKEQGKLKNLQKIKLYNEMGN